MKPKQALAPKRRPAAARSAAGARTAQAAHELRIIGGQWKRSKLKVLDKPGLRPTPDRVRETLFNWLGQDLRGWQVLDAFAGTGALGLEAASRGAAAVTLLEQDAALVSQLQAQVQRLQGAAELVRVLRGDGVAALGRVAAHSLHLVLLDPPFDAGLFESALRGAQRAVAPNGFVYLEAPSAWGDEQLAPLGLRLQRHLQAGAVHAHLLVPVVAPAAA
ncbi:MAG: 16S rRNA (guanine(966)-N(2))-methyltransferase RsmD [Rhodoferax sp.]